MISFEDKSGAFYSDCMNPCYSMILNTGWYIWVGKICYGPFRTKQEAVDYKEQMGSKDNKVGNDI